ncbi:hypothetical protein J1614_007159 [Plenodomus biglobosus]|nr:hypothetical protein J1614_007159 [Plenodomus biglobosus]
MPSKIKDDHRPPPAYFPTSADSPLHPPTELYIKLRSLSPGQLVKTQDFTIPPRSGRAWTVPSGCLFRLSTPAGPQVGDLNIWNVNDPLNNMLSGSTYDYHCHSNLTRAVLPHGLTEFDVHDVLNVFQVTGLDPQGRYFMEHSPATESSFLDFFAEQDLLCALSTCPGGDLSAWGWHHADEGAVKEEGGEERDMKSTCRPIRVEVFEVESVAREEVLKGWKRPEKSGYKGMHGMQIPQGED